MGCMNATHTHFDASAWAGRDDGPGPEHRRWHSVVSSPAAAPGAAVLGFASDEGVRRNGGRPGTVEGPDHIRRALSSLAVHDELPRYDAGTVAVADTDLESGHEVLSDQVAQLVAAGHLAVVLGGGHETSFGSHRGLRRVVGESVAIINLDAHFDLRQEEQPTSGTPFRQIAELAGESFSYCVLGVSRPNNTAALFDTADRLGVRYRTDDELALAGVAETAELARALARGHDHVHLSIDLDVLPAGVAPGVSAPAAVGMALAQVRAVTQALAASGKLRLLDVVELNPRYDVDGRTAKVAARLVDDAVSFYRRDAS